MPLVSAGGIDRIAGMQLRCSNGVCISLPLIGFLLTMDLIVIALVFTFYVLSFVVDLLPSVRTRNHVPQGEKRINSAHSDHPEMVYEEPLTQDSAGPNANRNTNYYRGAHV